VLSWQVPKLLVRKSPGVYWTKSNDIFGWAVMFNADMNIFIEEVKQNEGVVLESPSDHSFLLLDPYCRRSYSIPENPEGPQKDQNANNNDRELFLEQLSKGREYALEDRIYIHILCCDKLPPPQLVASIRQVAYAFSDAKTIQVRLLVDEASKHSWWEWALATWRLCSPHIAKALKNGRYGFHVEGKIEDNISNEEVINGLAGANITIRNICKDLDDDLSDERCESLQKVAHTGLRVPIVLYLRPGDQRELNLRMARVLQASQYSGLGIRSVQDHPD